jgi:uncharacterized membrane protein YobD (UPF0266 family)
MKKASTKKKTLAVVVVVMFWRDKDVQIIFKKMGIKYGMYYITWLKICRMVN